MKCVDVQDGLWKGEMTADMWEHLKSCRDCRAEQDLLQSIGSVALRMEIPSPTRSLLPSQEQIEQAITFRKRKRFTPWVTASAAACVIVVATQLPIWHRSTTLPSEQTGTSPSQNSASSSTFAASAPPASTPPASTAGSATQQVSAMQQQMIQLLGRYGWTADFSTDVPQKVQIMTTFQDQYGQFPQGLFWNYHNVLSKDIGLDMTSYNGQSGFAHILPLKQEWTDGPQSGQTTAVIIEVKGKVVGAWLQKGMSGGYAASLQKHYFGDLVQVPWGDWLVQQELEDPTHGLESEVKDWNPEQIVYQYYGAVNNHNTNSAFSLLSKAYQFQYLQANLADHQLISNGWEPILGLGLSNIDSAKVQSIVETNNVNLSDIGTNLWGKQADKLLNRHPFQQKILQVTVDENVRQITSQDKNGRTTKYFRMVKETKNSPWQIDLISNGS